MSSKKNRRNKSRKNRNRQNRRNSSSGGGAASLNSTEIAVEPLQFAVDEMLEDRAVGSRERLAQLSDEMRVQADSVRLALEQLHNGDSSSAQETLREIPRTSPYADWRLLVRGLAFWYADDLTAATAAWSRLDRKRRPGRIAEVLQATSPTPAGGSESESETEWSASTGYSAVGEPSELSDLGGVSKSEFHNRVVRVRRIRIDRPALELARKLAAVRHRDPETKLSAVQISMLDDLRQKYIHQDPQLVRRISDACVRLAFDQSDPDSFRLVTRRVPGPVHDPAWTLTSSNYAGKFRGAEELQARTMRDYLTNELPGIQSLSSDLRAAIASVLYEKMGDEALKEPSTPWNRRPTGSSRVGEWFEKSVEAWPKNRSAYQGWLSAIERPLDAQYSRNLLKKETEAIAESAAGVRELWIKALPDETAPRLWLIDHYLEIGKLDRAKELVESLAKYRLENARVKLLPFKIQLMEALEMTRLKRNAAAAAAALRETGQLWPDWLSRDLLLMLRAALHFRSGEPVAFDKCRTAAIESCGLPPVLADVMTLATLQWVNLPSAQLKHFRERVDRHARKSQGIPTADLARLGSFYWDLVKIGMSYPAYRMHGSKFGIEICNRLSKEPFLVADCEGLMESCLWAAEASFFSNDSYEPYIPEWLEDRAQTSPIAAAAALRGFKPHKYAYRHLREMNREIQLVRDAPGTEPNPIVRWLLQDTIDRVDELLAEESLMTDGFGFFQGFLDNLGGGYPDDDYEDDEDEDDDDYQQDDCDCPTCRARRSAGAPRFADLEDEDDEENEDDETEFSLEDQVVMEKIGTDGKAEIDRLIESSRVTGRDVNDELMKVVRRHGVSEDEFMKFLERMMGKDPRPKKPPEPEMSPDEKRAFLKKRQKKLEKKNRKR